MRGRTTASLTPSLVFASEENAEQPCGTTTDAAMKAAAAGTRKRMTTTLSAPRSAGTATGRTVPASRTREIDCLAHARQMLLRRVGQRRMPKRRHRGDKDTDNNGVVGAVSCRHDRR